MTLSREQRRAQGQAAEDRFRAWLDRCTLPHIYVEQSPLTIPQALKGEIKRPDFLVGIPAIGTIAIDVKAKSVHADAIIIDAYEHRTLLNFETYFSMSVWFACFPPAEPNVCHLFLNRSLAGLPVILAHSRPPCGKHWRPCAPGTRTRAVPGRRCTDNGPGHQTACPTTGRQSEPASRLGWQAVDLAW